MNKAKIIVTPIEKIKIDALPNSWSLSEYKNIIDLMGLDTAGMSDSEVLDMALMSLSDVPTRESAEVLLKYVFGDKLTDGQIQNLAIEMPEEKMWEEYPDINYHRDLFRVNQLLYKAYNGKFPRGHALKVKFDIQAAARDIQTIVQNQSDALLKLIISGTEDHSVFHRLYDIESKGIIEDSKGIIWHSTIAKKGNEDLTIEVISSSYWLDDYNADEPYECILDLSIYHEGS